MKLPHHSVLGTPRKPKPTPTIEEFLRSVMDSVMDQGMEMDNNEVNYKSSSRSSFGGFSLYRIDCDNVQHVI